MLAKLPFPPDTYRSRNWRSLWTWDGKDYPSLPGVYVFIDRRTRLPFYIGSTCDIKRRVYEHKWAYGHGIMGHMAIRFRVMDTPGPLEAKLIRRLQPLANIRGK